MSRYRYSGRRYGRDLSRGAKIGIGGGLAALLTAIGGFFFLKKRQSSGQAPPALLASFFPSGGGGGGGGSTTSLELRTVTTNDPPPSGDLIVFDRPGGEQIGGAEKSSQVELLAAPTSDGFAKIRAQNPNGRWSPVTGFVHAKFLK